MSNSQPVFTPHLSVVAFDFGGTLERADWDEARALNAAGGLLRDVRALGVVVPATISDAPSMLEAIVAAYEVDRRRREGSLRESTTEQLWADILGDPPGDALAGHTERLTVFFEENAYVRTPVAGGRDTLSALRDRGMRLAVISNVITRTRVPKALAECGLAEFFERVVMSSVYGVRKPHPAVFHHTAALLGCAVSDMAYVGDRVNRDVLGARRAGCGAAILFTGAEDFLPRTATAGGRPRRAEQDAFPAPFFEPDLNTDSLDEIAGFIETRRRPASTPTSILPTADGARFSALLFDAADILYFRPNGNDRVRALLKEQGIAVETLRTPDPAAVAELRRQANEGTIDATEQRRRMLALHGVTDPEDVARTLRALETHSNDVCTTDGVPETLAELKRLGVRRAVVSNTALPLAKKLEFFEHGGYGHHWDAVVLSCDVGIAKPDPGIYRVAVERLGVAPTMAAFVGHEQHELDGARKAGLATIAFNGEGLNADLTIIRFADLPGLIAV